MRYTDAINGLASGITLVILFLNLVTIPADDETDCLSRGLAEAEPEPIDEFRRLMVWRLVCYELILT